MRIRRTRRFQVEFNALPGNIKRRAQKQLALFVADPKHPSLRTKKMKGHPDIWEGRVTGAYRFTFELEGEICTMRRIGTHDILGSP